MSVKEATQAQARAQSSLRALEERAKHDASVTAETLVVAREEVKLAAWRVQGAQEREDEARAKDVARRQRAGEERRRRAAAPAKAGRLRQEQNAIEMGTAQQVLGSLSSPDARRQIEQIEAWKKSGSKTWPGYQP